MVKSVQVTNANGETLKLELSNPESSGLMVLDISGLGPPRSNVEISEMATMDGGYFNSARMGVRNIVLTLGMMFAPTIEASRLKTYQYFPVKKQVKLRFETESRTLETVGYVESNEPNIFSEMVTTDISILCPDPHFYAPSNHITEFFSVEPLFEFPFENESVTDPTLILSAIDSRATGVVTYYGDTDIGVKIHIHALGPATNIHIHNMLTRETMVIDTQKIEAVIGKTLIFGDDIVINTAKGRKGVYFMRDGKGYNILNCLGKNSDWFTITRGDNLFAFTADEGLTNLQFRIENPIVYEGV